MTKKGNISKFYNVKESTHSHSRAGACIYYICMFVCERVCGAVYLPNLV